MGDEIAIEELIKCSKTIAVVGLSKNPSRPSYSVASYLKKEGYKIIPVNPNVNEVLGEKAYPDLKSILEPVDVVNIFRKSEAVVPIVKDAIQIGAKGIWMQLGVINEKAKKIAENKGLRVIMDRCIKIERERLKREGRI